ncbi:MAG: PcfB family protein [Oscillospiraceae bacterium]|nr:PcfB family protein [Oscillospiraceae bacterium]
MVDEDISRRSIAISVKTAKLSAKALAYVFASVGRKLSKHELPHGKMSVKKLMSHGTAASSIELSCDTVLFDRVARKWNVDYAFYKTEPGKYLLFFKSNQADAMTACFAEYSKKVLKREKSEKLPIREQIAKAREAIKKQEKQRVREVEHER